MKKHPKPHIEHSSKRLRKSFCELCADIVSADGSEHLMSIGQITKCVRHLIGADKVGVAMPLPMPMQPMNLKREIGKKPCEMILTACSRIGSAWHSQREQASVRQVVLVEKTCLLVSRSLKCQNVCGIP